MQAEGAAAPARPCAAPRLPHMDCGALAPLSHPPEAASRPVAQVSNLRPFRLQTVGQERASCPGRAALWTAPLSQPPEAASRPVAQASNPRRFRLQTVGQKLVSCPGRLVGRVSRRRQMPAGGCLSCRAGSLWATKPWRRRPNPTGRSLPPNTTGSAFLQTLPAPLNYPLGRSVSPAQAVPFGRSSDSRVYPAIIRSASSRYASITYGIPDTFAASSVNAIKSSRPIADTS